VGKQRGFLPHGEESGDTSSCRVGGKGKVVMTPIETQYRNHKIVIRDEFEPVSDSVMSTSEKPPRGRRIIIVDDVDVTDRCRVSETDEQKTETAMRFIDRIYPKRGNS
jgi:hypothetical protein